MNARDMNRRTFLSSATAGGALLFGTGCAGPDRGDVSGASSSEIDAFIAERMARYHLAGVAACVVRDDRIVWSHSYGLADLEQRAPMSLDGIQNICSISKTFTTTALMQLWEQGRFQLDDDVGAYTPFPVRSPHHPDLPITFRHLLTHVSSIRDGNWYNQMYRCGDPEVSLAAWIEGYLRPGGQFYDAQENFQTRPTGETWEYNNVAYGLLGYLVQEISGEDFSDYCQRHVFAPLGMDETSWYLADIDVASHVVPYTYREGEEVRSPTWGGSPLGVILEGSGPSVPEEDGHHANCIYNHPNFPDGFLRTSVRQLSRAARAYLNGGVLDGERVLEARTVQRMMQLEHQAPDRVQGLTWYRNTEVRGSEIWGHGGSDPGINTDIRLVPDEGVAAIVFTNTWGGNLWEITDYLVRAAATV